MGPSPFSRVPCEVVGHMGDTGSDGRNPPVEIFEALEH